MRLAVAVRTAKSPDRDLRTWRVAQRFSPFVLAAHAGNIISSDQSGVATQIIDVPMRTAGQPLMMAYPCTQTAWAERRADVYIPSALKTP